MEEMRKSSDEDSSGMTREVVKKKGRQIRSQDSRMQATQRLGVFGWCLAGVAA
jgi:hypothetical protein